MEEPEKHDPVWKLLSRASHAEPGPFFSRNVVREVRLLQDTPESWWDRLRGSWMRTSLTAVAGAAAVVLVAAVLWNRGASDLPEAGSPAFVEQSEHDFDPATELETIEYLGQLMAVADPAQLTDEALADLFF